MHIHHVQAAKVVTVFVEEGQGGQEEVASKTEEAKKTKRRGCS